MLARLTAGDTLKFSVSLSAYPASVWTLHYRLSPRQHGTVATFDATADGDAHQVTVAAATTADWTPGWYTCAAWVTNASAERYGVPSETLQVEVLANLATLGAGQDLRSQAQRALEDARAALAAWSPTTRSYTIAGRSMTFATPDEIIRTINYWASEVSREAAAAAIAAGMGSRRRQVYVRLGRG